MDSIAGGQHRGAHLLRAGLAVGSADRDHRPRDRPSPGSGQEAVGAKRIADSIEREPRDVRSPCTHDRADRARGLCGREMLVPVESVPLERHEQRIGLDRAGVGGDLRIRLGLPAITGNLDFGSIAKNLPNRRRSPDDHRAPSPITISRSSNGTFTVPMT